MNMQWIKKLQDALNKPLPGHKVHMEMAVVGHHRKADPPPEAEKAGVLALFVPGPGNSTELTFIRRSSHYHMDRHKGQIGFPGGRYETSDADMKETALRETREEIGVNPSQINLIGSLSNLYIPVSNFLVYPFVGYTEERPSFKLQETEVAEVICCDYKNFLNDRCRKETKIKLATGIQLESVPYFDLKGNILWGATAMMMAELVSVLDGIEKSAESTG